jgi:5-methyltetrahydropteroyltriglutamate--homocysteine methyltransferase
VTIDHIRTTHTGSLPRPDELVDLLYAEVTGELDDRGALETSVRHAVADCVRRQVESGVEIVNDGETGKVSYSTYVTTRLSGFENRQHVPRAPRADAADFPDYAEWDAQTQRASFAVKRYACTGRVRYVGHDSLQRDIDNLKAAIVTVEGRVADVFMTAASPGVIQQFQPNQYYPSTEAYLADLADAMREEYVAIVGAGFMLQVDCPDLTGLSGSETPGKKRADFGLRIEVLNHALRDLPPDRLRLHLCWGNYEGPHHLDVPLRDLLDDVLTARPMHLSFEGANPRHAHEWALFESVTLPDDKMLIPGVLDSTTNYIEHPELVAQRLVQYARLVGRERVVAGTDCGFGTFAGRPMVHPEIAFAKLRAMAEGARLASRQLWPV